MNKSFEPELNLLLELDPEAVRWRRRFMFLASILLHALMVILLLVSPDLLRRGESLLGINAVEEKPKEQMTYLFLPPDVLRRMQKPPETPNLSDKDRRAQGRSPIINPFGLRMPYSRGNTPLPEIAGGGKPKPEPPPAPAPAPASKPSSPGANAQAASPPASQPKDQQQSRLQLEDVKPPSPGSSGSRLQLATPGQAIQQSLEAAVQGRALGRIPGDGDSTGQFRNLNPNFSTEGPVILSDTRGVDFGPYLARIVYVVRQNWYAVIPESARLGQKGRVAVDFDIQKDGSVPDLQLSASSGADPLDRAALAGIRASIPFPPLPAEFTGNHLKLRFIFLYNLGFGP